MCLIKLFLSRKKYTFIHKSVFLFEYSEIYVILIGHVRENCLLKQLKYLGGTKSMESLKGMV